MTRGGQREGSGRPSRKMPITKITVYKADYEKFLKIVKNLSIKIPVVELLHRIVNHGGFKDMIRDIDANTQERWHEQEL